MTSIIDSLGLHELINKFEKELSEAEKFRPRYVELTSFMPSNDEEFDKAEEKEDEETVILEREPEQVHDISLVKPEGLDVLALDTSSFRIGETDQGIVAAYRATIVLYRKNGYTIANLGPLVVNITEENKLYIYNYLRELNGIDPLPEEKAPSLYKTVDRIRNMLERYLQWKTADLLSNSLVLWDGSLTAGTHDTPVRLLERSIEKALDSNNSVIGFSKTSRLRTTDGRRLIDLLDHVYKPSFIRVNDYLSENMKYRILGQVYVVKLSPEGYSFRVDIAPSNDRTSEEVLTILYSSVPLYNGYPDPLRQAHINCYFTANDVLSLQSYVVLKYGLEMLEPRDMRGFILYPFSSTH